jgi:hypothetical protein
MDTIDQTDESLPEPEHKAAVPNIVIGQPVWYYDPSGMVSHDREKPFAALVVDVLDDRLVNLVVFDHNGTVHPTQSVAVFLGDDDDDKSALAHCELEAQKPKEAEPEGGETMFTGDMSNGQDHSGEAQVSA